MVLTNIRIYLKVNERSVDRLGRFEIPARLQSSRAATGTSDFWPHYATLQLLCGLLSVLDYVFEESL